MQCPKCRDWSLQERPAKNGVLVDWCARCRGLWLDGGEILMFSRRPRQLKARLEEGLSRRRATERQCPRCGCSLHAGQFLDGGPELEHCPQCDGIWFDHGELNRAVQMDRREFDMELDAMGAISADVPPPRLGETEPAGYDVRPHQRLAAVAEGMMPLPNLFVRSASVLILLYAILGAVLIAAVELGVFGLEAAVGLGIGIVVIQFAVGPFIMDLMLGWLYRFSWLRPDELPDQLRQFVERMTAEHKMRFPRFGLIHDGAPNAFTYGHTPKNMRIVISQGILDLLEPAESEAVVAHEIGHGKHWDMALMTLAQLVPLLLYYLYRSLIRMRSSGKEQGARIAVAVGAYVLYLVSQYLVLWFSRCREYHADRFAGEATGNPNALASALVKIAYGLAAQGTPASASVEREGEATQSGERKGSRPAGSLDALGALGIFDAGAARSLVVTAAAGTAVDEPGNVGTENLKSAMQWDLWNPWAKFYELHSTHPLVAHRLQYLSDQAVTLRQKPYVVFDRHKPESYWDEFFVDLFFMFLPALAALATAGLWMLDPLPAVASETWAGLCVAALGAGMLVKTLYTYKGTFFAPLSVAGLLHKVKVSSVRPVAARLRGRIIGRGVPGLIWSEDFVMRDATGILFLDYRQPLRIWEWLFGLLRAGEFAGREVEVTGWYRRAPVPYLEILTLKVGDRVRRCYAYHAKVATAVVVLVVGVVLAVL